MQPPIQSDVAPPPEVPFDQLVEGVAAPIANPDNANRADELTEELKQKREKHAIDLAVAQAKLGRDWNNHWFLWAFRLVLTLVSVVFVCVWQVTIYNIVQENGRGWITVPEGALIALVTTTTANVIGLLVIVMKFIFSDIEPKT
jgi:uncharacterized membrane protein YhdT